MDIETYVMDDSSIVPYCISCVINESVKSWYKDGLNDNIIYKCVNYIFNNIDDEVIIYIHNIDYDGRLIIEYIMLVHDIYVENIIKDNSIYSVMLYYNKKKIEFRCSYKLIPMSLSNIAESFKIGSKMPYPYECINNLNYNVSLNIDYYVKYIDDKYKDKFIELYRECSFDIVKYTIKYCENDVIITMKAIEKFLDIMMNIKFDYFSYNIYSISSLSVNIFKSMYNNMSVNLKYNEFVDNIIRKSYFGGRCEIFGNRSIINDESGILHYDFSGMYAQCMCEKFCYGGYRIVFDVVNFDNAGFYDIEFESDMYIPVLPHHDVNSGKLLFSNGVNRGLYWFEEIKLFLEMGGVVNKINYAVLYDKYDFVLRDFVERFRDLREKGGVYKLISKMIVNSLYGRLAMRPSEYMSAIIKRDDYDSYLLKYDIKSASFYGNICIIKYYDKKARNNNIVSNISISSAIASKARIKLYRGFLDVMKSGGRILYCDTDSIFAEYCNVSEHINKKYGEIYWDESDYKTFIKDAVFLSPKEYIVRYNNNVEVVKIKGVYSRNIKYDDVYDVYISKCCNHKMKSIQSIVSKKTRLLSLYVEKEIDLNSYDKRMWLYDDMIYTRALRYNYKTHIYD